MITALYDIEIGSVLLDKDLKVQRFTAAASGILNCKKSDIGHPFQNITTSLSYPSFHEDVQRVLKTLAPKEARVKNESDCWYSVRIFPHHDNNDEVDGVAITFVNIDEMIQTEDALKDSEAQYRDTLNSMSNMIHVVDRDLRIILFNKAFKKLNEEIGLDPDPVGKYLFDAFPFLKQRIRDEYKKALDTGEVVSAIERNVIKGKEFITETTKIPIFEKGKIIRIVTEIRDVTEREKANASLAESEEKYRNLFEHSNDSIFIIDPQTRSLIDFNEDAAKELGYTKEELLSLKVEDFAGGFTREAIDEMIGDLFKEGSKSLEAVHVRKDGTKIDVDLRLRVIEYKGKQVIQSIVRDITDQKKAEKALQESEERFRRLSEAAMEGIAITDQGIIVDVNSALPEIYKCRMKDMIGKNAIEFVAPEYRELVIKRIQEGYEEPYEQVGLRMDGSTFDIETTARSIPYEGRMLRVTTIRDITEKKRAEEKNRELEEQLNQIQRLESIGVLAGGIAHDFNNLLTSIWGNITIAMIRDEAGKDVNDILQRAETACTRARDLTEQLLTFSKGGAPMTAAASVKKIIRESSEFSLHGSNVKCEFLISDDLWAAEVDEGQIGQVINNIILNADQAMPDGGVIEVNADNVFLSTGGKKHALPLKEGRYVKILIKDEGIGISEKHLPNIFDPYFTTKQKGSGLGLTICHSIIMRHGGHISVSTDLGKGTIFIVYLPASDAPIATDEEKETPIITGKGRILIMDDEKDILEIAGMMLEHLGYTFEVAVDGNEAIELLSKSLLDGNPFDAAILDLTIPGGMGGKETVLKLKDIHPELKAIVSTGYSTDPVMAKFSDYGFSGFLPKPYKIKDLGETLYSVLSEGV